MDDLFNHVDQMKFNEVIQEGFGGATEHGKPQIFWPKDGGETVAAWRAEVKVQPLSTLKNFMPDGNSYRTVERFRLTTPTTKGPVSTLVFNSHQPASVKRKFSRPAREKFCSALIFNGIVEHETISTNVGFIAGGDNNCNALHWSVALSQTRSHWSKHFGEPSFVYSTCKIAAQPDQLAKAGDCHVTMGTKNFNVHQCDCFVHNRDPQHDCIIVKWDCSNAARISWTEAEKELRDDKLKREQMEAEKRRRGAAEHAAREVDLSRARKEAERQQQEKVRIQEEDERRQQEQERCKKDEDERQRLVEAFRQLQEETKQRQQEDEKRREEEGEKRRREEEEHRQQEQEEEEEKHREEDEEDEEEEERSQQEDESEEKHSEEDEEVEEEEEERRRQERESESNDVDWGDDKEEIYDVWNLGRILAFSADLLPCSAKNLNYRGPLQQGPKNCFDIPLQFDNPELETLSLTADSKEVLRLSAGAFFWTYPARETTHQPARRLKSKDEIVAAWIDLLWFRHYVETDDTKPLYDPFGDQTALVYNKWSAHWIRTQLRADQEELKPGQKTSIFRVYIKNRYGSQCMVMALIQTGISWSPPREVLDGSPDGAAEHIATYFIKWLRQLLDVIAIHKEKPDTVKARLRSGTTHRQSGLTDLEQKQRVDRTRARANFSWAENLEKRLLASKGKGKGTAKGKVKGKDKGASEHNVAPKPWAHMSRNEQWHLQELWNGNLRRSVLNTEEAHGGQVQAHRFFMRAEHANC